MDKKDYTMVALSIGILISLGLNAMPEPTHYCDSRELKAYCFSLSDSQITCYTLPEKTGGKRCSEGWKKILVPIETTTTTQTTIPYNSGAQKYLCDQTKCVPIE